MRLEHILLVIVFALLASSCKAKASATTSDVLGGKAVSSHHSIVDGGGALRVAEATDSEERNFFSLLTSWVKTNFWLETGKSAEDVKKILQLENLSDAALKASPNFKLYDDFVYALQGRQLDNWLSKDFSTQQLWAKYKLGDVPASQLKDNDKYKTFVRYAKMEDDMLFKVKNSNNDAGLKIDYSGSPAEIAAKLDIWVAANRPNWYVKDMLNLDRRGARSFRTSPNYKYLMEFWARTQKTL